MRIALGADHAGFELKEKLKHHLETEGYDLLDEGTADNTSVDYPDFARKVAHDVAQQRADFGLLVCGSGIGMAIAANKVAGVRAANVTSAQEAQLSREHNDANIIALGARLLQPEEAQKIVDTFLRSAFAHGRHSTRVEKISAIEREEADQNTAK